jgi:hypothetical protein
VGDCVHNLRSALDACVWDLATMSGLPIVKPQRLQFPLVLDRAKWQQEAADRLRGIDPDLVERLAALQPFNQPEDERAGDALLLLHQLDVDDKHRSNVVVRFAPVAMGFESSVEFADAQAVERNVPPDTTVHEADATDGALLLEHRTRDPIVKVGGNTSVTFGVNLETARGLVPVVETLANLVGYTLMVLQGIYGGVVPAQPTEPSGASAPARNL